MRLLFTIITVTKVDTAFVDTERLCHMQNEIHQCKTNERNDKYEAQPKPIVESFFFFSSLYDPCCNLFISLFLLLMYFFNIHRYHMNKYVFSVRIRYRGERERDSSCTPHLSSRLYHFQNECLLFLLFCLLRSCFSFMYICISFDIRQDG